MAAKKDMNCKKSTSEKKHLQQKHVLLENSDMVDKRPISKFGSNTK
jgi:hypothetical protein